MNGSCFATLQIVAPAELANYESEVRYVSTGCSVRVRGKLVESQGKGQSFEVQADEFQVVGGVDDPDTYPLQPKRHSYEFLREVAHLRARTNTFGALARVRHCVSQAIHRFFDSEGFAWIHTPIVAASDCEGAGEVFRVSTLELANLPRNEQGQIAFKQLLRSRSVLDRLGPTRGR